MYHFNRQLRAEQLECRILLAADFSTVGKVFDVRDLAAIYAPQDAAVGSLASNMGSRWNELRAHHAATNEYDPSAEFAVAGGVIRVSVHGNSAQSELLRTVRSAGMNVDFVGSRSNVLDGSIALGRLHELLEADGVAAVVPARPGLATNSEGSVANAAEIALRGETIRSFLGLTGEGVTIGVISDGVESSDGVEDISASQASGDLPPDKGTPGADATIDVLDGGAVVNNRIDREGTAMLELVHDIAPGADLLFHAAGISESSFAAAVDNLVDAGADIIVDDINGLATESWFADGVAATSISNARAEGVLHFSSAGNRGDNRFEAATNFMANQNVLGNVGAFHDFNGAGDYLQTVTIANGNDPNGTDFQLHFDQLFGAVQSDLKLWVFDQNGNLITSSTQNNAVLNDPNDFVAFFGTGNVQIAIELVSGPAPNRVSWLHWGDVGFIEHETVGGNIRGGRDPGHAATIGNIAVGATDVANPLLRRSYSGVGEVTRSLDSTGTPLPAVEFRGGPTLMGVDGTATSVPNYTTFFGTSAAAPNVAAMAALILEANQGMSASDLEDAVLNSARDIDAPGLDLTSGRGLLDGLGAAGFAIDTLGLIGLGDGEYAVVNDGRDLLDADTDPAVIDVDLSMPNEQISLRAAVQEANDTSSALKVILLPEDTYNLTRTGSEGGSGVAGDAVVNDLDITNDLLVVGAGAGLSVIDVSGLSGTSSTNNNRAFEAAKASSDLHLSRLTITGGDSTDGYAGDAVGVWGGASLTVEDSAFVGNEAADNGVAIHMYNADVTVLNSVFTGNRSTSGGAAIRSTYYQSSAGSLTIGGTVFALNPNSSSNSYNVLVDAATSVTNLGNNLFDEDSGNFFDLHPGVNDYEGIPDYVVTSVEDEVNSANDGYRVSLREAIMAANDKDGVTEEVWLPPWELVLTRDRASFGAGSVGTTDIDAAFGDLDISDRLTIRGIDRGVYGKTDVQWKAGVSDKTFDLLGDFDGNYWASSEKEGGVLGSDQLVWQQQDGSSGSLEQFSADGDDDGDVDADDLAIWQSHYGNWFDLINLDEV